MVHYNYYQAAKIDVGASDTNPNPDNCMSSFLPTH